MKPTPPQVPCRLNYRKREAAEAMGISARTLDNLLAKDGAPPCVRIGRRVLFPVDALAEWNRNRTIG